MVVFRAELEVTEHHGDVGARDDKDEEHQKEEPEHIIVVAHPQGLEDEKHLDEHGTVWEDPAHRDGE